MCLGQGQTQRLQSTLSTRCVPSTVPAGGVSHRQGGDAQAEAAAQGGWEVLGEPPTGCV